MPPGRSGSYPLGSEPTGTKESMALPILTVMSDETTAAPESLFQPSTAIFTAAHLGGCISGLVLDGYSPAGLMGSGADIHS